MDWQSSLILAGAFILIFLAWIRTIPRRRFVTFAFLVLPAIFLSLRWAAYRGSWATWLVGAGLAALTILGWWIFYGRKLPPPKDGIVRIWTKDEPFE